MAVTGERYEWVGGGIDTTLTAGIGSGAPVTITLANETGWPTGAVGSFYAELGFNEQASAEKVKCSVRSGNSVTVTDRGEDGTTAASWDAGTRIRLIWPALEADRLNQLLCLPDAAGDLFYGSAANAWERLAISATATHIMGITGGLPAWKALTAAMLGSGTADATKFLRGDLSWQVVAETLAASIIAAKGDLIVGTADDTPGILTAGANTSLLLADSSTASGLRWGTPANNAVVTQENTTSTSYTDLATAGPAVTVTTGTAALVICTAQINNSAGASSGFVDFAVSGATSRAASDGSAIRHQGTNADRFTVVNFHSPLTAGSNTFTMKYRVDGGTGTFALRTLTVIPF